MFRMTPITKNLLICNVLAFLATIVCREVLFVDLNNLFGLHFFMASNFHVYQLFTYMFMHAGWEHIILNMFMLWMFGCVVESTLGPKRFLAYYIICGIGAGLMQELAQFFYVYFTFNAQQPLSVMEAFTVMKQFSTQLDGLTTVGASGAIYSLLLAFGMMFPNEKMFIIPIPIPIKAKWMVLGSIVVELVSALGAPGDNVAHLAHLGGMIFGWMLIRYWKHHPYQNGYGLFNAERIFSSMKGRWEARRNDRRAHRPDDSSDRRPDNEDNNCRPATQEEIDRILDKIRRSGYDSLTREEKQTLFDQSRK